MAKMTLCQPQPTTINARKQKNMIHDAHFLLSFSSILFRLAVFDRVTVNCYSQRVIGRCRRQRTLAVDIETVRLTCVRRSHAPSG
jgi:hypothetical protein